MRTYYVIYDPMSKLFVREGRELRFTYNLNNAKHLTSEWNAKNIINRYPNDLEGAIVRKVSTF